MEVEIREEAATKEVTALLIGFSKEWEAEDNVYGYRANEASDIEGNRIFLAYADKNPVGYLFGKGYESKSMTSVMPERTACFEIEEIYVSKGFRSQGIGKQLFDAVCDSVKNEYEFVTLTTATKNYKAILHFYIEEAGMELWSSRLYKKL